MSFNKRRNNNEGQYQPPQEKAKPSFIISNKSFQVASLISSTSITLLFVIVFIAKITYSISEGDIQNLCQITAGLSGLTLAIPLFLKDFDVSSNFWKQFYLIAVTFLCATFIGIFSFLQTNSVDTKNVTFYFWFFFAVAISTNFTSISFWKRKSIAKISISQKPLLNFCISYLVLIASLFFANGDYLMYCTILFSVYGFYLTLSLMLSILVELFLPSPKAESNDLKIKKAIEELAYQYKNQPLDEQDLIDKLRKESLIDNQEIISRSKVQELVSDMDLEVETDKPKIAIYDYNYIIPRWSKEFDNILRESNPKYLFLGCSSAFYYRKDLENLIWDKEFLKSYGDTIYKIMSEHCGLSVELLKDNNSLIKKYRVVKFMDEKDDHYHSQKALLLVDINSEGNSIFKINLDEEHSIFGDTFTQMEYKFIVRKIKSGEVYFDGDLSIEFVKKIVV
jgi:hypothetical protein